MAQQLVNLTSIHEDMGFNPWPRSVGYGSSVAMSCGVSHRHDSDPMLLWHRRAATAPIGPLAWEPPYAAGAALKEKKTKKKKKKKTQIYVS